MRKKIKILYSDYEEPEKPGERESAPVAVDLSAIRDFYAALGDKQKKSFEKFAAYWESEGFEKLFNPAARVVSMPLAVAEENFGAELLRVNDSVERVVMSVWTIGTALEKKCGEMMSAGGSLMTGLILDAAGSIALYEMHGALCGWIKENSGGASGLCINGEFYPGIGSMRQDLMEKIVAIGGTEAAIGVGASGHSLLRPRKSQCSFVALGSAEHESVLKAKPCRPCAGKRCLYYQLGGCHMQEAMRRSVN